MKIVVGRTTGERVIFLFTFSKKEYLSINLKDVVEILRLIFEQI